MQRKSQSKSSINKENEFSNSLTENSKIKKNYQND